MGAGQLIESGYRAERTPRTGDRGADIVIRGADGRGGAIIQCKHRQDGRTCDGAEVDDPARARDVYGLESPGLVVLSNARRFSRGARLKARRAGAVLVGADGLRARPGQVVAILAAATHEA